MCHSRHPTKCDMYLLLFTALETLTKEPMDDVEAMAIRFAAGHIETACHNHQQNDHEDNDHDHDSKTKANPHLTH